MGFLLILIRMHDRVYLIVIACWFFSLKLSGSVIAVEQWWKWILLRLWCPSESARKTLKPIQYLMTNWFFAIFNGKLFSCQFKGKCHLAHKSFPLLESASQVQDGCGTLREESGDVLWIVTMNYHESLLLLSLNPSQFTYSPKVWFAFVNNLALFYSLWKVTGLSKRCMWRKQCWK